MKASYHEQDKELRLWAKNDNSLQKWSLGPASDFHHLENALGMVLEVQDDQNGGVSLCAMPKSSKKQQLWRLTPQGHIQCRNKFLMLGVRKGSRIQGAKLTLSPMTGSSDQLWKYIPAKGYFQNKMTGLVLDSKGGSTKEGAEVWLWSKNSTLGQRWQLSLPPVSCSSPCQK